MVIGKKYRHVWVGSVKERADLEEKLVDFGVAFSIRAEGVGRIGIDRAVRCGIGLRGPISLAQPAGVPSDSPNALKRTEGPILLPPMALHGGAEMCP